MLTLRNVDAGYDTFQALFGVSLEVNAGEAIGVIGPNGAGKTTLMRVISGLIRPTAGQIEMAGTDLLATPAHRIVEASKIEARRWQTHRSEDELIVDFEAEVTYHQERELFTKFAALNAKVEARPLRA